MSSQVRASADVWRGNRRPGVHQVNPRVACRYRRAGWRTCHASPSTGPRTARSWRWPSPRSGRWSPSRCSCWPTPRSSGTSAPLPLAGLGIAAARAGHRGRALRLPGLRHDGRRSPAGSAPATCAARSPTGVDGVWLALGARPGARGRRRRGARRALVGAFGASGEVAAQAVTYLRWSLPGLPAMLVVLAATGVLRGLQDTRTPLVVAAAAPPANAVLNVRAGLRRRAWASPARRSAPSLAQIGMAAALSRVVVRAARREGAPLRPDRPGHRARPPAAACRCSSAR